MPRFDFGTGNQFSNYDNISRIAAGQAPQQLPQQQQQSQIQSPQFPMREMTGGERIFAGLADIGNALSDSQGFSNYYENNGRLASLLTPEGFARFALNLPAGMAGALPTGVANLYAAGTGSDVVYGSDLANNMIREEKLDAGQRLASAITGGIDTFGLAVGGSGSAINEIGRAVKAGRGIEAAAKTGSGARMFGLTGSSFANRGVMTPGQAFAFDVAEEAGEEAVQSLSEDVIQKQLDDGSLGRAFEGAVMGATGGAMMSAPAHLMRSMTNEQIEKSNTAPADPTDKNVWQWGDELVPKNASAIRHYTKGMEDYAQQQLLDKYIKSAPGSASAMFVSTGKYNQWNEIGLTIGEIRNVAAQSVEAFNDVLHFFNNGDPNNTFVDANKLTKWLRSAESDAIAKEMWDALEKAYAGSEKKIALLRNPGTDEGCVWVRVAGISTGRGIDMSGTLAKAVGGDYDSDRGAVFFNIEKTGFQPAVWASDVLLRNEDRGGTSPSTKFEYEYSSMVRASDDVIRADQKTQLKDKLLNLANSLDPTTDHTAFVQDCVDVVFSAYDDSSDNRNVLISQALLNLQRKFNERFNSPDGRVGRDALASTFDAFAYRKIQSVEDAAKDCAEDFWKFLEKQTKELKGSKHIATPGTTYGGTAFSSFEVGNPESYTAGNMNQFYRNYATAVYQFCKSARGQSLLGTTGETVLSAYGQGILFGCKMIAQGTDPSDAVITMIQEMIKQEYLEAIGVSDLASDDWSVMESRLDKFEEIYRKYAKVKNDVMKQMRRGAYVVGPGVIEWNENLSRKENGDQYAREYLRILGNESISSLIPPQYFGTGNTSILQIQSIAQVVHDTARIGMDHASLNVSGNDGLSKFFASLVRSAETDGVRIENRIRALLSEVDLTGLLSRVKNGEDLDTKDIDAWLKYCELVECCSFLPALYNSGIIDPNNWVDTTIGRMLTSSKIEDRLNALVAINFRGKFYNALKFRANPENNGKQFDEDILIELEKLAAIDTLHRHIVEELLASGTDNAGKARSRTLERLIDIDSSFESKQQWINDFCGEEDGTLKNALLMSSISSPVDTGKPLMDTSLMSQIMKGKTLVTQFNGLLRDNANLEVQNLIKARGQYVDDQTLVDTFNEMASRAVTRISLEPLCLVMSDGANYSNHQPEKGTTIYSSSHYYMQVDLSQNGDQTSFITDQFNSPFGVALLQDVLSNPQIILRLMSDPNYYIKAFDHNGNSALLSQTIIFDAVCGSNFNKTAGVTAQNIIQILTECPVLITYLGGIDTSSRDSLGGPKDIQTRPGTFLDNCLNAQQRKVRNKDQEIIRHNIELDLAKMKNALLCDARTPSYLYSCLRQDEKNRIRQGFSPSPARLEEILDKMARGIYAMKTQGKAGSRLFVEGFTKKMLDRLEMFSNIADRAISANFDEARINYQNMTEQLNEEFFDSMAAANLLEGFANSLGVKITDPGYTNFFQLVDIEERQVKYDQLLQQPRDAFMLHLALADALGITSWTKSKNDYVDFLEKSIKSWIDDGMVDPQGKSARDIAINLSNLIDGRLQGLKDVLIPIDHKIFQAGATKNDFDELMKSIGKFIRDDTFTDSGKNSRYDEIKEQWDKLPSDPQLQDVVPFAMLLNSYIINRIVNDYQYDIGGTANSWIGRDYADASSYIKTFLNDPRFMNLYESMYTDEAYGEYLNPGGFDAAITDFPVPDYSDRASSLYGRQLTEIISSGRVLTEVGRNGMESAELFGIDACPIKPLEVVTGDVKSWAEISALTSPASIDRQYVRLVVNGQPQGEPITIGELKAASQQPADNDTFEIFKKTINPHGVCLGSLLAPPTGEFSYSYKFVIAMLNRMQMAGMEDLVLKVRKEFGTNGDYSLARQRRSRSLLDNKRNLISGDPTNLDVALKAYDDFVGTATRLVHRQSMYKEDLEKIGIGEDEIRAVVQMMVAGIDITYEDEQKNRLHKIIDIKHLYDGQYESLVKEIPGKLVRAEMHVVPLQVISSRIEKAISQLDGATATAEQVNQAAYDAMFGWDEDGVEQLSVRDILDQIRPLAGSYNNMRAEGDLNSVQKLFGEIVGAVPLNYSNGPVASFFSQYAWHGNISKFSNNPSDGSKEKSAFDKRSVVNSYMKRSRVANGQVNICRVFGHDYSFSEQDDLFSPLADALSVLEDSTWFEDGDSVLVLDKTLKAQQEAVAYAMSAHCDILIPAEYYNLKSDRDLLKTEVLQVSMRNQDEQEIDFIRIPYTRLAATPRAWFGFSQARVQIVSPKDYFCTILLDNKGTFPGVGDSVTRFLKDAAKKFGQYGQSSIATVNVASLINKSYTDPTTKKLITPRYGIQAIDDSDLLALSKMKVSGDTGWDKFEHAFAALGSPEGGMGKVGKGDDRLLGFRKPVIDCIHAMSNQKTTRLNLKGMSGGQCATIMKIVAKDGSVLQYIPVMIPKNVGTIEQGFVMPISGSGTVDLSYSERIDFDGKDQSVYAKWDLTDMAAAKSMVSFIDSFEMGDCYGFDGVLNYETLKSRMRGREIPLLYRNMLRKMYEFNMHFICEYRDGGLYINRSLMDRGEQYVKNTINGKTNKDSLWADILSGSMPAGIGGDIKVFQKVIKQAKRAGIPIMSVFGAGDLSFNAETGFVTFDSEQTVPDADMAFDGLSYNDVIDFFAAIGANQKQKLCQSTHDRGRAIDGDYLFDNRGRMQVTVNGQKDYYNVFVSPVQYMGHSSSVDTPGNAASVSLQQRLNKYSMYGIDTSSAEFAIAYANWKQGTPRAFNVTADATLGGIMDLGFDALQTSGPLFNSWREARQISELKQVANDDHTFQRTIVKNGPKSEPIGKLGSQDDEGVQQALIDFSNAIGWHGVIPISLAHYLVNHKDGTTRGDLQLSTISAGRFIGLLKEIEQDFIRSGRTTLLLQDESALSSDRITMPVINESILDYICNNTSLDRKTYIERMWQEEAHAIKLINMLSETKDIGRQRELRQYGAALRLEWKDDQHPWNEDYEYFFGGVSIADITRSDGLWGQILKLRGFDEESFEGAAEQGRGLIIDMSKKLHQSDSRKKIEGSTFLGQPNVAGKYKTSDIVTKTMETTISLSRLAAVANPGVFIGNLVGRATSQTTMDLMLDIGARYKIGPLAFANENVLAFLESGVMTQIDGDEAYNKTWNALRHAALLGEDLEVIAESESAKEIIDKFNELESKRSPFQHWTTKAFDLANGGNFFTRQQSKLFLKRLVQFMSAEPALSVYFQKVDGMEHTLFEAEIMKNPSKFLLDCFNRNGHPELFLCAQEAMNSALEHDMAQRNFFATWFNHLVSQTTLGDFILSTTICKFPKYQFNLVGKYMQWFGPTSTTYTLLLHAAQKIDEKWAETHEGYTPYNFELDQRFVNLREAMAYDMTHMGAVPLMCVLLAVGNAIEPPDDEKKWGDPDEWLICGYRIGESWWLTDMLGAFMPSVLYIKSAMLGNPTSSLLINGTLSACYGNPFLRAADAVNVLLDWNDGVLMDYQHTAELYADAEGGAPGYLDWVQANAAAGLANWATSLITPSIIKEIYRNSEPFEKSYNRVYQTTPTGKLSENGEKGYTQKTNYQDAMLRKACRNNPVLALALDLLNPSAPTGYLLSEMPDTLYLDSAQVNKTKEYSVSGLDETEAEKLMWNIYFYINGHSVEAMQKDGFYLDKETLNAFCSFLWDAYYRIEDDWIARGERGELSYTYLGDGDYDLGKQAYNELLNDRNANKRALSNLYYDKIRGSYLSRSMQQYKRYATSYRTDSEGNLYATGMRRQGALPFISAPGTANNPEGTAGYENDFMSISAVTGQPMDQRALVPVQSESYELPAFEGFSKNGDGKGYSGKWSHYNQLSENPNGTPSGSTPTNINSGYPNSGYPNKSYSSGGSGGSGGGGGSRRSSGSPSTYVPGISSRNYAPNTPNAATARASRAYDAQFDYLRPNVETKGSRDAYKRGDM